ncbi:MAG: PD-(D/E)XK nuclease family protein [Planctomycetota bacterium]|nr:PD-(D/E)XK nuclease family protein [Planctomycetota bacterium]
MKFLEKVVDHLAGSGLDLGRIAVVFPSRRAGLFFEHYMQQSAKLSKPLIAPDLFSIHEFVERLSGRTIQDELSLLFRLYKIHQQEYGDEPFESFYVWGRDLLDDFGEIDEHLVDPGKIFGGLETLAGMEAGDGIERGGQVRATFLKFASKAGRLYARLIEELAQSGEAYYGLALRRVAETLAREPNRVSEWEKIAFVGFNALTAGEKKLIKTLKTAGKAELFWDMDRYFTRDDDQEAGRFFRENRARKAGLIDKDCRWIEDLLGSGTKNISVVGTAGNVAQAKACAVLLERLVAVGKSAPTDSAGAREEHETAIVLPDESLLFPLLHSLPPQVERVNVTMGFPLRLTPVFTLIAAIIEMRENCRRLKREGDFYFADVEKILFHPHIQAVAGEEAARIAREQIDRNAAFVSAEEFAGSASPVLKNIFAPRFEGIQDFCAGLLDVLKNLRLALAEGREAAAADEVEFEYFYALFLLVQRLQDLVEASGVALELSTFWRLLRAEIDRARVPFYGEPLKGFQVMGLLETRALDFKNVIILSANEGVLPAGKTRRGFIPHEVRRLFGLPGYDSHDAMYAYNFYRLLCRAENIHIFHNTEHDEHGAKAGKSRFLEQLLFEYAKKNANASVTKRIAVFSARSARREPIEVAKSPKTLEAMLDKTYSPTMIGVFLECPLKFYFKEVLGLEEPEDVREHADVGAFGSAVHRALADLYRPYVGKTVTKKEIAAMSRRAREAAEKGYRFVLKIGTADRLRGRNFLYVRIIEELVAGFLEGEGRRPPCEILDIESDKYRSSVRVSMAGTMRELALCGRIDRVDACDGLVRVIDYKTGTPGSLKLDWDRQAAPGEARAGFVAGLGKKQEAVQLLVYFCLLAESELLKRSGDGARLGVYAFGSGGYRFLHKDRTDESGSRLRAGDKKAVRERLQTVFEEMFDKDRPFVQCEDDDTCERCAYKDLCCR